MRKVVDELCTTENVEFITYFEMIEDNVEEIQQKKPKMLFKEMYKYSSGTLSSYLKGMPQDAIYNHPILWQVYYKFMNCSFFLSYLDDCGSNFHAGIFIDNSAKKFFCKARIHYSGRECYLLCRRIHSEKGIKEIPQNR